jgi:hypothetical protein
MPHSILTECYTVRLTFDTGTPHRRDGIRELVHKDEIGNSLALDNCTLHDVLLLMF